MFLHFGHYNGEALKKFRDFSRKMCIKMKRLVTDNRRNKKYEQRAFDLKREENEKNKK